MRKIQSLETVCFDMEADIKEFDNNKEKNKEMSYNTLKSIKLIDDFSLQNNNLFFGQPLEN